MFSYKLDCSLNAEPNEVDIKNVDETELEVTGDSLIEPELENELQKLSEDELVADGRETNLDKELEDGQVEDDDNLD